VRWHNLLNPGLPRTGPSFEEHMRGGNASHYTMPDIFFDLLGRCGLFYNILEFGKRGGVELWVGLLSDGGRTAEEKFNHSISKL